MYAELSQAARETALERAINYVTTGWLPPNKDRLKLIQDRLASGAYDNDRAALVEDLKGDIALYTICLRELATLSSKKGQLPHQILHDADLDSLRLLLSRKASDLSTHSCDDMSESQIARLKECIIAATTADTLAPHYSASSDDGYTCSVLRQLGLTLISWNYPRVYAKAVENSIQPDDLDTLLHKSLGFSPHTLGVAIAQRWGLSDKIISSIQSGKPSSAARRSRTAFGAVTDPSKEDTSAIFSKICEVGEALARANNPQLYPCALDDWESASKEIAAKLGDDGVKLILVRSTEFIRSYRPDIQPVNEDGELAVRDQIINSRHAAQKIDQNTMLKLCPEDVRATLTRFYHKLKPGPVSKDLLRELIANVLPKCGFIGGCVYTVDPATNSLVPSIKFGKVNRDTTKAIRSSLTGAGSDLVTSAFTLKAPLKEDRVLPSGDQITMLAGALGNNQRVGVLYLEVGAVTNRTNFDPTVIFKAARHTLADCLNLI
jgi:hypothetical protein